LNSFLYTSILFLSTLTFAQTKVDISLDTNRALVGDVIQMDINVNSNVQVIWPDIEVLIAPIEVQSFSEIDSVLKSNLNRYHQNLSIQLFDTGDFVLPQLPFVSSEGDTFYTDSLNISFVPVLLDTTNVVFDIKGPEDVPFNFSEAKPIVYGSFIILVLILLIYYLIQKIKIKKGVIEEEIAPSIPCEIEALEALKNLESRGLCEMGEIKNHYVQLTEILRCYFDRQFEIETIESTTDEIVERLKEKNIDSSLLIDVTQLLEEADLVKFAKSNPDNFTNKRFMESSYRIVECCHNMNEEVLDV